MTGKLKLDIAESVEELKSLMYLQKMVGTHARIHALYLLKLGVVKTVGDVALLLGRDRITIQRWLKLYRDGGLEALLTVKHSPGRKPAIPADILVQLGRVLDPPRQLDTYAEVRGWLKQEFNLDVSYKVVRDTVRNRLSIDLKTEAGTSSAGDRH
ncbi:helix-turn-helix domain-containing protein [Synechococcus sp. PCC 7336]|uniref:helix-turn-helix domain-containing protein n=1 Tax=Synechococcus sp. PCC 7336 TaxID=195250 RepID=UPI00034BA675|nr:helix-turn-helix domain-containing protein [Synechococcus sp. PCC 7336]